MEEIIKPFKKSLFDNNIKEICINISEVGIDSFLQEGLIKDIPIVSTIVKLGQFAYNVYDRNLLRQTFVFIKQFNNNSVEPEKLEKYKESLEKDFSKAEKELGRVLIILNKIIDSKKSVILAKLYSAYINQNITWEDFCELSDANDRLFVKDISILYDIYDSKGECIKENHNYIYQRLMSIGFVKNELIPEKNIFQNIIQIEPLENQVNVTKLINITSLGNKFCEICR
ncbi:hypothetical protein [Clostridium sp. YIM B02569]|uniref:hypothetical protein n=1 Tax=Clostridium sp. YIM B02569 TaxID=2911967 RepID=UPI001EEF6792|nr:hypothetical protein [Clostridium sp. YIM B02569]